MRRRYKVVLNVEITDPDKPHPAGGDYTHLTMLQGVLLNIVKYTHSPEEFVSVTLDKVIGKGEVTSE